MKQYSRIQYEKSFELLMKYEKIVIRHETQDTKALYELVDICDTKEKFGLIDELLSRFYYMSDNDYQERIAQIADHIIRLKYDPQVTVIMAMAHSHESDGSQDVLNALQVALIMKGFDDFSTDSRMDKPVKHHYNKGKRNFVIVDDFLGTGITAYNRYKELINNKDLKGIHISFCIVSGMKEGIDYCHRHRMPLYCPLQLNKGLSGVYSGFELSQKVFVMRLLEMKLAPKIGDLNLESYSMGWGKAESLFYREGRNIPNNVYPIFWWKQYRDGSHRETLFYRKQNGY